MPIEQHRLYRLIQAAQTYLRRDKRLRAFTADMCAQVAAKRMTPEDAISAIAGQLAVTRDYDPHEVTIQEETVKYNLTHRRNVTEKMRMRAKRGKIPFIPPNKISTAEPNPNPLESAPLIDIPTTMPLNEEEIIAADQARATRRMEEKLEAEFNKSGADAYEEYKKFYKQREGQKIQPANPTPNDSNILDIDIDPDL